MADVSYKSNLDFALAYAFYDSNTIKYRFFFFSFFSIGPKLFSVHGLDAVSRHPTRLMSSN